MKATILAGGFGTRLRPITDTLPKPMIPVNGKPLLQLQLELLRRHGINDVLVSLHHLPDKIQDYFGDGKRFNINITYSVEERPLGTAGSLTNIPDFFNETFLVMYGDNLTDLDITSLLNFHKRKRAFATIALHSREKSKQSSSFVLMDDNNKVLEFVERPSDEDLKKIKGDLKFINSGIYILEPEILDFIPKKQKFDFAYDLFPLLLRNKLPVFGFHITNFFREIGTFEKYQSALKEIKEKNLF